MNDTIVSGWAPLVLSAATGLFCLVAAAALASLIRLNKGARLNRAWGLIALGLAGLGAASLDRTFELLDLPRVSGAREAIAALGSLLVVIGAVYGRSLYRGLLK